ncbi:MAG: PHP domain-containing protein [Burkholderiales bacterium]|nr:PHP domain-containing protein [Burkholderiales bacterium]
MQHLIPVDLHSHTTNSDGSLSVTELLTKAKENGGKYLALTDHDTVNGIKEAREVAKTLDLQLIAGVEISVTWNRGDLVHIVGLNVDENNQTLVEELNKLRASRIERGRKIAANLAKVGIHGAFEGAMSYCKNPEALSRTHFNQWLVDNDYAKASNAFSKYLAPGKPGYAAQTWTSLENAVTWIKNSGGIAVIAHPARYNFTRTKLIRLIEEFKGFGGRGLEVVSSSHSQLDEIEMAKLCQQFGLLASVGSDFHKSETYRKIYVGTNKMPPQDTPTIFSELGILI